VVRRESDEVVLRRGGEIDSPGFQPQDVQTVMGGDEQAAAVSAINREPVDVRLTQQVGQEHAGRRWSGGRGGE
jgi:hypothetical protein